MRKKKGCVREKNQKERKKNRHPNPKGCFSCSPLCFPFFSFFSFFFGGDFLHSFHLLRCCCWRRKREEGDLCCYNTNHQQPPPTTANTTQKVFCEKETEGKHRKKKRVRERDKRESEVLFLCIAKRYKSFHSQTGETLRKRKKRKKGER